MAPYTLAYGQIAQIAEAGAIMEREHPRFGSVISTFVMRGFDAVYRDSAFVSAAQIVAEAKRNLTQSLQDPSQAEPRTRMERLADLLAQSGSLSEEIEREEGGTVHVLLLDEGRNGNVDGVLATTVTAYLRPA